MSLRCKACDRMLDTRDPDYCRKCLDAIYYSQNNLEVLDRFIENDLEIVHEAIKFSR